LLDRLAHRLGLQRIIQSLLLVPLRTRTGTLGLLDVGELRQPERADFSPAQQDLVVAIADQTAALIERMQLQEMAERRSRLLMALDEASRHIRAERQTSKLLIEIVRLAAQLAGCAVGGLFINRPHLQELELAVTDGLLVDLVGRRQSHAEGLFGFVARTGETQVYRAYDVWTDRDPLLAPYPLKTMIAIPIKHAGDVEAVLFAADSTELIEFTQTDKEILERFAEQAAIALRTSYLIGREQRMFTQLAVLHKISDYIQTAGDLEKILHVVLTGVTAGYGLGFNRAAFLLIDERHQTLVARLAIGHMTEPAARQDWLQHIRRGLEHFDRYLQHLEQGQFPLTPLGERLRDLRLPLGPASEDLFSALVADPHPLAVVPAKLEQLPGEFVAAFEPAAPLAVAPLVVRGRVIGLLVADNKFTRSPITADDLDALMTFASSTAIAIDNTRLLHETEEARQQLRSSFQASNALVSPHDPDAILHEIVAQARLAAQADGVSMVLIDEMGHARAIVTAGIDTPVSLVDVIRPDGISMRVLRAGQLDIIEDTSTQRDRVNPGMFWRQVSAAICLPISLEGKSIGVMWVHYHHPRRFSDAQIEALQLYVNQAAIAYDSSRRIKELEHMRHAAEALAGAAGWQDVLTQIVRGARDVLQADSAVIWPYDAVHNHYLPAASIAAGVPDDLWEVFRHAKLATGGTADTVMEQGLVAVHDICDRERYPFVGDRTHALLAQIGARSFQGIALCVGDERLGVLYVNYSQPRSFNKDEQRAARTFANHAALALKKARLLDQLSAARNAARVVARVTVLAEDLDRALQSVAEGTQRVLGCDAVTLYVYDQHRNRLRHPPITLGVRDPQKAARFGTVPQASVVFTMLNRDQPYIVEHTASDSLFAKRRFTLEEEVISLVAIPLKVGGECVGVMFVNYRAPHRFTSDELLNIELFADQAAVAISNAQRYERLQLRAAALQTLYETSLTLTATLSVEALLKSVVDRARQLTGAQIGALGVLDSEGNLRSFMTSGLDPSQERLGPRPQGHGILGLLLRDGPTIRLADIHDHPAFEGHYPPGHPAITSFLGVPIRYKGLIIGDLYMANKLDASEFSDEDEDLLESLAAQAAVAIENARLFEQTRQAADRLTTIHQLSVAATLGQKVQQEILQTAIQEMVRAFDLDQGGIVMFDWDAELGRTMAEYPEREEVEDPIPLRGNPTIDWILEHAQPLVIDDAPNDAMVAPFGAALERWGVKSMLLVPLIVNGEVAGTIGLDATAARRRFTSEDQELAQTMANHVASAIENARLNVDLRNRVEELERTRRQLAARHVIAWMGTMSSTWRHAIDGHALTICEETEALQRKLPADARTLTVEKKLSKIKRLAQMILDKPITPPLSSEEGVIPLPINPLLRERLQQLWKNEPNRSVECCFEPDEDSPLIVRISPEWLRRAFDILIDNAVDAVQAAPVKRITVSTDLLDGWVRTAIRDTGGGIPAEILASFLQEPVSKSPGDKGMGIGALLAQMIAQTYGGEISVADTGPAGTTIVLLLPQER
ncbi:MAG TPA: hypothetical protein DEP84_07565, partial [Chloroflexi bacterium]|nr:hypothetical protein [Chloroflexota bacterium]